MCSGDGQRQKVSYSRDIAASKQKKVVKRVTERSASRDHPKWPRRNLIGVAWRASFCVPLTDAQMPTNRTSVIFSSARISLVWCAGGLMDTRMNRLVRHAFRETGAVASLEKTSVFQKKSASSKGPRRRPFGIPWHAAPERDHKKVKAGNERRTMSCAAAKLRYSWSGALAPRGRAEFWFTMRQCAPWQRHARCPPFTRAPSLDCRLHSGDQCHSVGRSASSLTVASTSSACPLTFSYTVSSFAHVEISAHEPAATLFHTVCVPTVGLEAVVCKEVSLSKCKA